MFDLPTCLSKFMALGMSFADTVQAATARPAQVMGLQDEVGTLRPGALADVALFRIEQGDFTFYDIHMNARRGKELVRNTLTIVDGRELPAHRGRPAGALDRALRSPQALIERGHTPAARPPSPAAAADRGARGRGSGGCAGRGLLLGHHLLPGGNTPLRLSGSIGRVSRRVGPRAHAHGSARRARSSRAMSARVGDDPRPDHDVRRHPELPPAPRKRQEFCGSWVRSIFLAGGNRSHPPAAVVRIPIERGIISYSRPRRQPDLPCSRRRDAHAPPYRTPRPISATPCARSGLRVRHQPNAWTRPRMLSSTITLPTRIIKGWSGIL